MMSRACEFALIDHLLVILISGSSRQDHYVTRPGALITMQDGRQTPLSFAACHFISPRGDSAEGKNVSLESITTSPLIFRLAP